MCFPSGDQTGSLSFERSSVRRFEAPEPDVRCSCSQLSQSRRSCGCGTGWCGRSPGLCSTRSWESLSNDSVRRCSAGPHTTVSSGTWVLGTSWGPSGPWRFSCRSSSFRRSTAPDGSRHGLSREGASRRGVTASRRPRRCSISGLAHRCPSWSLFAFCRRPRPRSFASS
jgi:hypothetical protein